MNPLLVTPFRDLRRERLRNAVAAKERAIASGEAPDPIELEPLAQLCVDHFLPVEAARVRRWIAGEQ
jgi:hypothetical protein